MRYVKPDSNKLVKASTAVVQSGDGIWFSVLSPVVGSAAIVPLIFAAASNIFALLFFLPLLLIPAIWLAYGMGTVKLAGDYGHDKMYADCLKAYNATVGDHTQELARPIMQKVLEHAESKHKGGDCKYYYLDQYADCKVCKERLDVLSKLAPQRKSVESRDDIEQAKQFLEIRKELGV